ncbi:hypothetical protein T06_14227 [Trichinella sp. T6]|nr:hypothetical protein T06_14227 [Trichinella sp. T6]
MKLVPFASRVRMHVKAFSIRPIAADGTHCVSYGSDVLPYHAR